MNSKQIKVDYILQPPSMKPMQLVVLLVLSFFAIRSLAVQSGNSIDADTVFRRPKDGFRWQLAMKDSKELKTEKMYYLGAGKYQKTVGNISCEISIASETLKPNDFSMKQTATIDCGIKKATLHCETDKLLKPYLMQIIDEKRMGIVVFGCDNGKNDVPPRKIAKDIEITSSATIENIDEEPKFRIRTVFPYKFGQSFSWGILGISTKPKLKLLIDISYESPMKNWSKSLKNLKVSSDKKSATYEMYITPDNGIFSAGDRYSISAGDPEGYVRVVVKFEDVLAEEFWIKFKK